MTKEKELSIVKLRKTLRDFFLTWLVQFLYWIFQILPRSIGIFVGGIVGILAYSGLPRQRKKTLQNLYLVFGRSKSKEEIQRLGEKIFIALGKNLADVLRIPRIHAENIDEIVEVEGMERFEKTFQKGKGMIAITGHLGCWELIPVFFSLKGYPVNVIGQNLPENRMNGILQSIRNGKKVRVIAKSSSLRETLRCLRRGETLGILMDHNTRSEGFTLDFLGKPAHTPSGPILLSYKTGAPLIPLAIHRTSQNRHRIEVGEEIQFNEKLNPESSSGQNEKFQSPPPARIEQEAQSQKGDSFKNSEQNGRFKNELKERTQICSKAVENYIRQYPTEWVWMHERWKERK